MSETPPAPGDLLELEIEGLARDGAGVGRHQGLVVFVRGALPGDRVRARIESRAARAVHAAVEAVTRPSPARREARCAHFGACGGCALQDLDYAVQLEAKRRFVLDALRSIANIRGLECDLVPSPEWGWRSRAEMRVVQAADGTASLGYVRARSDVVVAVSACPVLAPELEAIVRAAALGRREIPRGATRASLALGEEGPAVHFSGARGASDAPEPTVRARVAGFEMRFGAAGFFQGNRALLEELVLRATGGEPDPAAEAAPRGLALELYSGSGLFTLPLARRFERVVAVEGDPAAVGRARANAAANRVSNATVLEAEVARWIASARRLAPDFVLLDPPRAGAGLDVVDGIARAAPGEVRYVSCDPGTLARDLKRFALHGYALRALAVLDLFPQTLHVECVARIERA